MYLEHFELTEFPFSLTPDTQFFTKLPHHQEALNVLLVGLENGEGFIKITGEVGTGKTILCRLLLNHLCAPALANTFVTAYIPNPYLTPEQLYLALADELEVSSELEKGHHYLLKAITEKLISLKRHNKKVVLLVDEAQVLPEASLEALRLLSNLETEKDKLLQVVLLGQPELDDLLAKPHMRQLKQRICFSYQLKTLDRSLTENYVRHRLTKAGFDGCQLFDKHALDDVYRASKGIPRLINVLCHKALMAAYGEGDKSVSTKHMKQAIKDTFNTAGKGTRVTGLPNKLWHRVTSLLSI